MLKLDIWSGKKKKKKKKFIPLKPSKHEPREFGITVSSEIT